MRAKYGQNLTRVINDLIRNGPSFNLFQVFFLCETIMELFHDRTHEEKNKRFAKGLNFTPHPFYQFPATDVRKVRFRLKRDRIHVILNVMGLYGIDSPLPRCYHEQIALLQRSQHPDRIPLQNFLDIFNNRLYWLYYQAWKKYRWHLEFCDDPDATIMKRIFSFSGYGDWGFGVSLPFSPMKLLPFSALLSSKVRHKNGLVIFLKEFFPDLSFAIKEFVPSWIKLTGRPRLGNAVVKEAFAIGKNQNGILGAAVVDYQSRICVIIGPINFSRYLQLLPRTEEAAVMRKILALYLPDGLEYDVEFIILSNTIISFTLSDKSMALGRTSFLGKPKQPLTHIHLRFEEYVQSVTI